MVIGGGSIGNSTLYHLLQLGIEAVLVEKDQLTAGNETIKPVVTIIRHPPANDK